MIKKSTPNPFITDYLFIEVGDWVTYPDRSYDSKGKERKYVGKVLEVFEKEFRIKPKIPCEDDIIIRPKNECTMFKKNVKEKKSTNPFL